MTVCVARVPRIVPIVCAGAEHDASDVYKPNKLCKAESVKNLVKCINKL